MRGRFVLRNLPRRNPHLPNGTQQRPNGCGTIFSQNQAVHYFFGMNSCAGGAHVISLLRNFPDSPPATAVLASRYRTAACPPHTSLNVFSNGISYDFPSSITVTVIAHLIPKLRKHRLRNIQHQIPKRPVRSNHLAMQSHVVHRRRVDRDSHQIFHIQFRTGLRPVIATRQVRARRRKNVAPMKRRRKLRPNHPVRIRDFSHRVNPVAILRPASAIHCPAPQNIAPLSISR